MRISLPSSVASVSVATLGALSHFSPARPPFPNHQLFIFVHLPGLTTRRPIKVIAQQVYYKADSWLPTGAPAAATAVTAVTVTAPLRGMSKIATASPFVHPMVSRRPC